MAASPLNRVAGVLPMWMACRGATLFALANASDFNVADFALECFFIVRSIVAPGRMSQAELC